MHIDISRSRFDPSKHYSGVLALQGRVSLDADQNEAQDIWRTQLRTSLADLIGPAGAPRDAAGFAVDRAAATSDKRSDLGVSAGRMYVDGILVENPAGTTYWDQPHGHLDGDTDRLPDGGGYVAYLRVWEREVTVVQDADLREVALGIHGPDTTARRQVVWQVAGFPLEGPAEDAAATWWQQMVVPLRARGRLRARAKAPEDVETDLCSLSASAQFRGQENQLYRVEVFRPGPALRPEAAQRRGGGAAAENGPTAQLVWSRDNGADVYPVTRMAGTEVVVADLGRDPRSALDAGDRVEIVDDGLVDRMGRDDGPAERYLYTVTAVDTLHRTVSLDRDPAGESAGVGRDPDLHPLLRRWDGGPVDLEEDTWLALEDGVEVQLAPAEKDQAAYRTGDHWLVPARRATGDVVWPQGDDGPAYRPPDGVDYHYAALAFVPAAAGEAVTDLRRLFPPLTG